MCVGVKCTKVRQIVSYLYKVQVQINRIIVQCSHIYLQFYFPRVTMSIFLSMQDRYIGKDTYLVSTLHIGIGQMQICIVYEVPTYNYSVYTYMYLVGKTKRTPLSHMSVLMLGLSCTNAAVNPQSISMMRERERYHQLTNVHYSL